MKKYDMSFIDLSEIRFVTANEERITEAKERLEEKGLVTKTGKPSAVGISRVNDNNTPIFLNKLSARMKYREGLFEETYETLQMLRRRKKYTAMYLYLCFLYGYVEWRMPLDINLLSSNDEALSEFLELFTESFGSYIDDGNEYDEEE